ncbi:hypothetical protein BKA62DRAFT_659441 [Auriculariales sp. MPI-PUGE-AT-0066]|nr:hypothetical protein BKA62DRAFT_659441 [Auriculariales sp. MPI-PUGE-AT-0066]
MAKSFNVGLRKLRLGFYAVLGLWAFLLLALCAARINYTQHLPRGDWLNGGWDFTDPSVAELLFTSIITLLFVAAMMWILIRRVEHSVISRTWFEIAGIASLWFFWIGGAAAASNDWSADLLARCTRFSQCRELQALVAFAWLGWITLTVLLVGTVLLAWKRNAWSDHTHGEWSEGPLPDPNLKFSTEGVSAPV